MELGLTFPLQRFLKKTPPPYGVESDRRFCWDLHRIALQGRSCLLAVHCHSRYTLVRYDVAPFQWDNLPELFRESLLESLTAAGYAPLQVENYLQKAGTVFLTRTHGRREVAFLNRAWDDVLTHSTFLDCTTQCQPLLEHAVNTHPSRCVGFTGLGTALKRITATLPFDGETP